MTTPCTPYYNDLPAEARATSRTRQMARTSTVHTTNTLTQQRTTCELAMKPTMTLYELRPYPLQRLMAPRADPVHPLYDECHLMSVP